MTEEMVKAKEGELPIEGTEADAAPLEDSNHREDSDLPEGSDLHKNSELHETSDPQKKRIQAINELLVKNIERVRQIAKIKEERYKTKRDDQASPRHVISLNLFFGILIMAEVLLIAAGSSGILNLVRSTIDTSASVPDIVWLAGFSIVLGILTIIFLTRFFSGPISILGGAVKRVADGDFSVRLPTDKGFREVREISRNFNAMAKELGATEILQTDFVSNVSHEFKTPITAIEGYVTLLGDSDGTTPEQKEYIEKILLNTHRLSTLVGNILLLSKIDNAGIPSRAVSFRLDEQIREAVVELEPKWSEKDCDFDVDMAEIVHVGNENLLIHVWKNLIENAIKFGPAGGTIKITLQKTDEGTEFTVTDEGDGISDEAKKHIFDRFYQSDSSHKSEGNGLGLALVKQIVNGEGGEVSVSDSETGGCKFTVTLK